MDRKRPAVPLPLALVIAILAVSSASILIRFAQRDVPSIAIAALRLTFATLIIGPAAVVRHRAELAGLQAPVLRRLLLAGLFLAVHFAAWITSLEYTSVASSVVFVSTGPLWVGLLSPVVLKDRLTRATRLGLGLAVVGGLFIGIGDLCTWRQGLACPGWSAMLEARGLLGNALALLGALAVAGYLMVGRTVRAGLSLLPYVFVVYGLAALCLVLFSVAAGTRLDGFPLSAYGWILLLALFPQVIGHSTYNWALRYLPATLVALATLGEPLASSVLAYFILEEVPPPTLLLGGLLILGGVYVVARQPSAGSNTVS